MQREDSSKITIQATGATSWRRSDVKYRKNEAFVDVIETVNLMMSKDGMSLAWIDLEPRLIDRCGTTRGCRWSGAHASILERNAGV